MGYYGAELSARYSNSLTLRIRLTPDDTAYYKADITCNEIGQTKTADFGYSSANLSKYIDLTWSGLDDNTKYTFSGSNLQVSWDNGSTYTSGGATFSTVTCGTTSENPENMVATLNSSQTSVTLSVDQPNKGGDYNIYVNLGFVSTSSSSIAMPPTVTKTIYAGTSGTQTLTYTVDVSYLPDGEYRGNVTSYNDAMIQDGPGANPAGVSSAAYFTINRGSIPVDPTPSESSPSAYMSLQETTNTSTIDIIHSIKMSVSITPTTSTSFYYGARLYYSKSSSVSSSDYIDYIDSSNAYPMTSEDQKTFSFNVTGLDRDTKYYFKAYARTGSSFSSIALNTSISSSSYSTETESPIGQWKTAPAVAQVSGQTKATYAGSFSRSNIADSAINSRIVISSSATGTTYLYVGAESSVYSNPSSFSINGTTGDIGEGTYTYYFRPQWFDSVEDEWIDYGLISGLSVSSAATPVEFTIGPTSAVPPTASWTAGPTLSPTTDYKVSYDAAATRNDSVDASYYMRIKITDKDNSNAIIYTGSNTPIAKNGMANAIGTTSNKISAGAHTYTFTVEWRQNPTDSWIVVNDAGGSPLIRDVQFVIDVTPPIGKWNVSPSVAQSSGSQTIDYSATVGRADGLADQFYVRIKITDSGGTTVNSPTASRISSSGSVSTSGTTSTTLSAGTHIFTFTPEWSQSSSGPWQTLNNASDNPMTTPITVTISSSGGGSTLSQWSWTNQNNSHATQAQVRAAHTALTSGGRTTNFPYQVWNSLAIFVYDTLSYAGGTWANSYGNLTSTLMTADDKILTAQKFMALTTNIKRIADVSTATTDYPATVRKSGDQVLGSYFTDATTALNAMIQQLIG